MEERQLGQEQNQQMVIQENITYTSFRGHELIFRRPLMRDMRGIDPTKPSDLCELAKRCVTNISPNDWERLDGSDSVKIAGLMTDFLF